MSVETVTSWGRNVIAEHDVSYIDSKLSLPVMNNGDNIAIFGNGRSYGDICLNPKGKLLKTELLDRLVAFDQINGQITTQSGVLLETIQRVLVKHGWMLPVTPGTQLITVGGAIANDVHCKNHHVYGSFGHHVQEIRLLRTDGEEILCGPNHNVEWFKATVGGAGLTGLITEATIKLRPVEGPWLTAENLPYSNVNEFFAISNSSSEEWEHTVSWIDCVNGKGERGVFLRGNHCSEKNSKSVGSRKIKVPFATPISLVNSLTLRPFNILYYAVQSRKKSTYITHYEPFFYPLDNLVDWNLIYGRNGFFQYQCVIPTQDAEPATREILRTISKSGQGSPLGVLKNFGKDESVGMLSFPMPGTTLALDFPNKGKETLKLFNTLDSIVKETKGRLYLAKDSRMPKHLFEEGYPRYEEFEKFRDKNISTLQSRRLMGW
ncbi:TPA: FAD-binding oxidoreductase [Vibrio cholerae]|nr:FAD-binding oxidoreductase [Vibrio cholerae]